MNAPTRKARRYEERLAEAMNSGKQIAVFFGTGDLPGHNSCMLDGLHALCREVTNYDDWLLVVKPKKGGERDDLAKLTAEDLRFQQFLGDRRVLWLEYREDEAEVCPSGWLVENMAFGAGNRHTIFAESLANGKPYFAYYPIMPTTEFRKRAREDGFYILDKSAYSKAIMNAFMAPDDLPVPSEYYKNSFDPFGDDGALKRMAGYLFSSEF
jgi:hypothetical protein